LLKEEKSRRTSDLLSGLVERGGTPGREKEVKNYSGGGEKERGKDWPRTDDEKRKS